MHRRLDAMRANFAGNLERVYSVSRYREAFPAIFGTLWTLLLPQALVTTPASPSKLLGPSGDFVPSRPFGAYLLLEWTGALHLLGRTGGTQEHGGGAAFTASSQCHAYAGPGAGRAGGMDEVEKLIEDILTMPSEWGLSQLLLPRATPAYVMLVSARNSALTAHREESIEDGQPRGGLVPQPHRRGSQTGRHPLRLGDALYQAER